MCSHQFHGLDTKSHILFKGGSNNNNIHKRPKISLKIIIHIVWHLAHDNTRTHSTHWTMKSKIHSFIHSNEVKNHFGLYCTMPYIHAHHMHTRFGVLLCDENRYASNSWCVCVCEVFLFAHRFFPCCRSSIGGPPPLTGRLHCSHHTHKRVFGTIAVIHESSRLNRTMAQRFHFLCNLEFIATIGKTAHTHFLPFKSHKMQTYVDLENVYSHVIWL